MSKPRHNYDTPAFAELRTLREPMPAVASVLPLRARLALVAAAGIEPGKGRTESQERTNALDHAIRNIKEQYPTYFQKGK